MNAKIYIQTFILIVSLAGSQLYGQLNDSVPPIPGQEEPEILNQGPIHEAFAQPVELVTESGIVSPQEPPDDIIEDPAEEKPESSRYVWIPGYWAWDSERSDYVWISGCWRITPVGMSWVPGYWDEISTGWQWVPGFWISTTQAEQIKYLPEPPAIAETEPPVTVVETEKIWVPPCYYWHQNNYILRAGYWLDPRDNWVWVPSHYSWTPHGYVFVSGYWDYALETRGILYAPVYFPRRFHRPHRYTYSLGVVVNIRNLEFSLFSHPRYCHYYFGDYYSDFYVSIGIFPWFEFKKRHGWYDPIYEHKRCRHRRKDPHWGDHIRHEYELRRTDAKRRPPRTYREIKSRHLQSPKDHRNDFRFVEPVKSYTKKKDTPFKSYRMDHKERLKIVGHADRVNKSRQQRRTLESHRSAPTFERSSNKSHPSERKMSEKSSRTTSPARRDRTTPPTRIQPAPQRKTQTDSPARNRTTPATKTRTDSPTRTQPTPQRKTQPDSPTEARPAPSSKSKPDNSSKTRSNSPTRFRPAPPTNSRSVAPARVQPNSSTKSQPSSPAKVKQPTKQSSEKQKSNKNISPRQQYYSKSSNKEKSSSSSSQNKTTSKPERNSQPQQRKDSDKKDKKQKSGRGVGRWHR